MSSIDYSAKCLRPIQPVIYFALEYFWRVFGVEILLGIFIFDFQTTLLNGISAASVLKDKQSWYEVKNCLTKLCPSLGSTSNDIQDNPWMEACVMSYTSVNGVCYQMFDTCMAMNDSDSQL